MSDDIERHRDIWASTMSHPGFLRFWCWLTHGKHHWSEPWGMHHYYCGCNKCGRRWDIFE